MPIIKSAKKRVRVAQKATVRNAKTKRNLKSALKLFTKTPSSKSASSAQSSIDTAAKKHVIHKNKAARLKRQAAARAKAAGVKTSTAKRSVAAKPATKEPATKAAPKKKPAATKKPPVKK